MNGFDTRDVIGLFPNPVYKVNLDWDFRSEIEQLKRLPMKPTSVPNPNMSHLYTQNSFVLEMPEMRRLKDAISSRATYFLNGVLQFEGKARITQSWANLNKPGQGTHSHFHSNSVVSGVYYMDVPKGASIVFWKTRVSGDLMMECRKLPDGPDGASPFAAEWHRVNVETGDLVMFASHMSHSVDENTTDRDRWSLAFNSVPDIGLGDMDRLTYLPLQG